MIFYISAVSVVNVPFSFIILLIWVSSLFSLVSLVKGSLHLFIFSNNQLCLLNLLYCFSVLCFIYVFLL